MKLFMGNSLWYLVSQSDAMTKFVLLGLLAASVLCWSIVFYKLVLLQTKRKQLKAIIDGLKNIKTLEQCVTFASSHAKTYPGHLLIGQLNAVQSFLRQGKTLSDTQITALDDARFSLVFDMIHQEEAYLSTLSVTSAVAPLLGLFGTVWGLTHAFISIGEKQAADIVTIAPGIAEALLTTIAGLMVAIPALVLYHYLRNQVDEVEFQLIKISSHVHMLVQGLFVEVKGKREDTIISDQSPASSPTA